MCSHPLTLFEGGTLVMKTFSCTSGLLAGGLLLLAFTNIVLVNEPLAVGSLFLAGGSGLLNEECLVLVRPQIIDGRLPICRRVPREREPHEEWALRVSPAAAIWQPVGLREWLIDASILHREAIDQRWPGDCSIRSS